MPDTNSDELAESVNRVADAASAQLTQSEALLGAARFGQQVASYYQGLRVGGVPERAAGRMATEYAGAILARCLWPEGHGCGAG